MKDDSDELAVNVEKAMQMTSSAGNVGTTIMDLFPLRESITYMGECTIVTSGLLCSYLRSSMGTRYEPEAPDAPNQAPRRFRDKWAV